MHTVTQLSQLARQVVEKKPSVTMDEVFKDLQQWRSKKSNASAAIPDSLWEKIFLLADCYSPSKIRSLMGISTSQYNSKAKQFHAQTQSNVAEQTQPTSVDFCEVKTHKPIYQPLDVPATHTIVVEFCRSDGQIMKIHTTSENFKTLITLFFELGHHATDHL